LYGKQGKVVKPFSLSVLIAKIQAVFRRTYDYISGVSEIIEHKGVLLNSGEGTLTYNELKMVLIRNELKIITLLLNNKGKIVSRETIMKTLWDDDQFVNDNTLTVNINRLRSRLEDLNLNDFISTKKGQGYIII
jgi:DNA-binding response OmpR family regulator